MDDIIRNLDNQKRWLSMAMDDFRDVSGIEQKIAKYRDSLNDAWPLLQAHPYGAAARAYLAEQERLFVFKQATEQAERQISQAKSQLRYAEMSLEREPERAKQQVAQALSIANGLLADPQYASLPIVQSFAPAFLEGPAREMHIKVNSAAILQEAENSLRTSKSHLRWVKGYIEGNNAESAERYLKMALDAAKPLQADPKFLAVPEVAAYLEELKMAEEAYTPKITSLALQSQFETDQREVTYLQKQIDRVSDVDLKDSYTKERTRGDLAKLKPKFSDIKSRYSAVDIAIPVISSLERSIKRIELLLDPAPVPAAAPVVVESKPPPPSYPPPPRSAEPLAAPPRVQSQPPPPSYPPPVAQAAVEAPPAPAKNTSMLSHDETLKTRSTAAERLVSVAPPMSPPTTSASSGLSVAAARAIVDAGRSDARWANYFSKENDPTQALARLAKAKEILAPLLDPSSGNQWKADSELSSFIATFIQDSTNIEATAMEQRYQQEFREDERKIGRLISNLQNYSDPDNFSRYGTENGLSYASQLQTYIDNVVQKFGEDRERVRTVLGNARTELDAAYQSIQVYEDRTTEAERNKPTKLVSEINNYLPSLDEPIRKALSEKRCTYTVTGDRGTAQPYVVCSQGGCANAVICGSCYMSQTCHRDGIFKAHPVEFVYRVEYGDYVCSCGASGHCHSIPEKPAAPWPSLPAGADADVVEVAPFPPHIVVRSQPTVDRPIQIYDTKSIRIPVGIRSALQRFNAAASEFNDAFNQGHTTLLTAMLDTSGSTYRFSSTVNDAISKMENFQYRSVLGVLEDYPNDIISEILTAARSRVSSLAVSKKVLWHKILANFEMDVKVRETLTYMRRLIAEAKQDSDVSSARSKYLDVIQFARIRLDSEGTDSVVTLFNETLDAFNTSTEAYARELVEKTHFTPDWQFIERLPNQIEEDGKDAKRASMLKSWIAEAKVAYEKRVEEESLAKEKEAKEFAETRKKEIEEREKKLKAIYLEPYTGGAVRAGNDVWRYYSDGTLKSDSCEIRFNGSGFFPQSGISNGGYWNGETFTWSANWKDVLALDWNDKNGTFSPRYSEPLMTGSWRWDGAELIPSNEAYRSRVAAVEGSVPLPLVLFVAVSAWLRETLPRVNGDRLCRTHLWESDAGRHRQGKICRDCRKREHGSSHTCPIDGSKIYFPRNPAMTDGTHGDRCVRCGGLNDLIPAWLCDDCGRNFEKKCIYAR